MKALLITRCGCTRDYSVTFPPPPDFHVALTPKGTVPIGRGDDSPGPNVNVERRVFELDITWPYGATDVAYYREKP